MEEREVLARLIEFMRAGKMAQFKELALEIPAVDIAEGIGELENDLVLRLFRMLPKDISADVFSYMSPEQQQLIVESASGLEIRHLMDEMFLDDTVDFLEEMPANVVKKVLQNADTQTRSLINQFLQYPEGSAGSLMTIEYVDLHDYYTVRKAMDHIRRTGLDKETVYTCYVIDAQRKLVGTVSLRRLIVAPENAYIRDIMETNVVCAHTLDEQALVAELIQRYDFMSIPVCDQEERLIGIITVDDIMDVIQDEVTEDFEKMAAITPSDEEYMKSSVLSIAKNRVPWLLLMMVSSIFTGMIITHFESMLAGLVVLTSFIPMLMGSGGNSGSQTSVTVIRNMALGEIEPRDVLRVLWKELRVAVIAGGVLALAEFILLFILPATSPMVALTVSLSLWATVVLAMGVGCLLPMGAKKIGLDPAIMASPMITTIVDACSLLIYFSIAKALLGL